MKKILLSMLVIALAFSTAFGQTQTTKTYPLVGFDGAVDLGNGYKQFIMTFDNSTSPYGAYIGNATKGLFSIAIAGEAPVGKVAPFNNKKVDNWGGTCNIYKFKDVTQMLNAMVDTTKAVYSASQYHWMPTNSIMNLPTETVDTNRVLVPYPGMFKRTNVGFYVKVDGGGLVSDISFEIMTYDAGNTGKTATYKMIVSVGKDVRFGTNLTTVSQIDTLTSANVGLYRTALGYNDLYVIDNAYTTSTTLYEKDTINIAEAIGVAPGYFNGKSIYFSLYTTGTGTNIAPGVYEPLIALDNLKGTYAPVSWVVPDSVGSTSNIYLKYNNGDPFKTVSTDYTAGDSVEVTAGQIVPVNIVLEDKNRAQAITIKEANDSHAHNAKFAFPETGAIKSKDGSGNYTVDVPYTVTVDANTSEYALTIPLTQESVVQSDTLQIALNAVELGVDQGSTVRLEIDNGVRFWLNVAAKGVSGTAAPVIGENSAMIYSTGNKIFAKKALSDVTVINANGQVLRTVSANQAAKGITMNTGVYIVKTGNSVEKVVVK